MICLDWLQLSYSRFKTSQTGGQQYNVSSPFSVPWIISCRHCMHASMNCTSAQRGTQKLFINIVLNSSNFYYTSNVIKTHLEIRFRIISSRSWPISQMFIDWLRRKLFLFLFFRIFIFNFVQFHLRLDENAAINRIHGMTKFAASSRNWVKIKKNSVFF